MFYKCVHISYSVQRIWGMANIRALEPTSRSVGANWSHHGTICIIESNGTWYCTFQRHDSSVEKLHEFDLYFLSWYYDEFIWCQILGRNFSWYFQLDAPPDSVVIPRRNKWLGVMLIWADSLRVTYTITMAMSPSMYPIRSHTVALWIISAW